MRAPIVYPIPPGTPEATCRGCALTIYWVKTDLGKNMPVDPNGTPHWGSCSRAKDFKTPKGKQCNDQSSIPNSRN